VAKIILFNPPSRDKVYLSTNVRAAAPSYPNLTLATLAGHLIKKHDLRIIDLELAVDYESTLFDQVSSFNPEVIGASASTPDYLIVRDIMRKIKRKYPHIRTVVGGVHTTALPQEAAGEACFDTVVIGEGDTVIPEMLEAPSLKDVHGIIYKDRFSGKTIATPKRKLLPDLDALPFPAWHYFQLNKYKNSRLSSRRNPVGLIETSRGCAFECSFCNKLTFGSNYRAKTPRRVVDEMEYMLKCGFKEIHIIDDSFTQDVRRAKEICQEIIRRKLKFVWSSLSGVRADKVDLDFFKLAKKSGCWQVAFGIESGDQDILDRVNKKITISQIESAVKLAKRAGINTFGFFILGLPGDTEETMRRTIKFAQQLPLDIAKFDICIPYPGTAYYNELKKEDRIKSYDWSKYICHQIDQPLFAPSNITWDILKRYYKKAFREFYLRPGYILRRFKRSLIAGDLIYDTYYFMKSKW